jgi:hypothetical protein
LIVVAAVVVAVVGTVGVVEGSSVRKSGEERAVRLVGSLELWLLVLLLVSLLLLLVFTEISLDQAKAPEVF